MDGEFDTELADISIVLHIQDKYDTYEDYLDSKITSQDLFYLQDKELARQLHELGYHGRGKNEKEKFILKKIFKRKRKYWLLKEKKRKIKSQK